VTLASRRLNESSIQYEADAVRDGADRRRRDHAKAPSRAGGRRDETSVVTEFRWIEAGGGLPVLCLHGLFGASDHWERLVEAVSPRCRAMALSLPIFETPPDDLSVSGLRAHVEAFMDAERVPPAVVIGNSLGGHVALDLALHAPERVRGLVLSGSSGLFERSFTRGVPHRPSAAFVCEKMTEVFHDPAWSRPSGWRRSGTASAGAATPCGSSR
jgi:pimeloyl-ACP methyl ester carboxylesterase